MKLLSVDVVFMAVRDSISIFQTLGETFAWERVWEDGEAEEDAKEGREIKGLTDETCFAGASWTNENNTNIFDIRDIKVPERGGTYSAAEFVIQKRSLHF